MAHVQIEEVQGWLEPTKLTLSSLDTQRETQIAAQVLARVVSAYPTQVAGWTDHASTPTLIRSVIAMMYAGWHYDVTYSENPEENSFADRLRAAAEDLIAGIISGAIDLIEVPGSPTIGEPVFYPTDASSAPGVYPTADDPSAGPARFSMGKIF
jgi:hypothetical protein